MNSPQGPRSRPAGEGPGGPLPHYEGVEALRFDGLPDALADAADRARVRREKAHADLAPFWCDKGACVLPYDHHVDCWDGNP